ncbi:MAG TPA: hypothetical protein VIP98_16685 [Microlunatus sp.]
MPQIDQAYSAQQAGQGAAPHCLQAVIEQPALQWQALQPTGTLLHVWGTCQPSGPDHQPVIGCAQVQTD